VISVTGERSSRVPENATALLGAGRIFLCRTKLEAQMNLDRPALPHLVSRTRLLAGRFPDVIGITEGLPSGAETSKEAYRW
jgi:hypothetical protein